MTTKTESIEELTRRFFEEVKGWKNDPKSIFYPNRWLDENQEFYDFDLPSLSDLQISWDWVVPELKKLDYLAIDFLNDYPDDQVKCCISRPPGYETRYSTAGYSNDCIVGELSKTPAEALLRASMEVLTK